MHASSRKRAWMPVCCGERVPKAGRCVTADTAIRSHQRRAHLETAVVFLCRFMIFTEDYYYWWYSYLNNMRSMGACFPPLSRTHIGSRFACHRLQYVRSTSYNICAVWSPAAAERLPQQRRYLQQYLLVCYNTKTRIIYTHTCINRTYIRDPTGTAV